MLLKKIKDDPQTRFWVTTCKYCGSTFIKLENATKYCSKHCRDKATQDNKANYQRKRRRKIRNGELISNETEKIGTFYFSKKINSWEDETCQVKNAKRKSRIL